VNSGPSKKTVGRTCTTGSPDQLSTCVSAVVVVVRHRSYGLAALTQQRHDLAAHTSDSPAGAGHQDETRLSQRLPSFVIHTSSPVIRR
jgi:hypothetical protein